MNCRPIVLQELLPDGLAKIPKWFPNEISADWFLGRPNNYVRKARTDNHLPIVKSKTNHRYAIISVGNRKVITKKQLDEYYSKRAKRYGTKAVPRFRTVKKFTDKEKLERLKRSEEIRDALGKIDDKFGSICAEAEGSKELEDLRSLLKI